MTTDAIGTWRARGGIEVDAQGGLRFHGAAGRLYDWLGERVERLALDSGASPLAAPETIHRGTLERAGYFEAFADGALPAAPDGAALLTPAACYHVYPALAGRPLAAPRRLTLAASCGRREDRAPGDAGRLQRFRMREAVFVGTVAWVAAEREAWIERARAFAASLGLAATLEPATDTFFGGAGRGRRLIQQIKKLKYELRMDAGPAGRLAVASFNLHEAFFTSRFDIGPASDGSPAVSGCAAFGLERWTLACLAQLDPSETAALVEGGVPRSTTNT